MNANVLAEQLADIHLLDKVQSRYLQALSDETTDLPEEQLAGFLEESAELLAERPQQDWDELTDALSQPESFAANWKAENEVQPAPTARPGTLERARQPRNLAAVVAVLLLVLIASWTYRYYTATPEFSTPCTGAYGPDFDVLEAAGNTEYRMPLVMDARYGIGLCLQAFDGSDDEGRTAADVIFDHVYFESPTEWAIAPVGWEIVEDGRVTGDASANRSSTVSEALWLDVVVWFEGDRCNISGRIGLSTLQVDYTYRGRQRTGSIDLRALYSIDARGMCTPEVRQFHDTEDLAFTYGGRFAGVEYIDTNSVRITPRGVSRNLCRYLRGIKPPENAPPGYAIEPLQARTVFQLERDDAAALIDGAVLGICPEFAEQRAVLLALLETSSS